MIPMPSVIPTSIACDGNIKYCNAHVKYYDISESLEKKVGTLWHIGTSELGISAEQLLDELLSAPSFDITDHHVAV